MKPLLVYESPNKFNAFKKALKDISDGDKYNLCYTQGRIYDLPTNEIGLTDAKLNLQPVDIYRANFLENNIAKSSEVLCATDNDPEGEWIASHIKELCSKYGVEFNRLRANTLSPTDFKAAYDNKTDELNNEMLSIAISRRIVDRVIGFSDNPDKMIKRGRVFTPTINYINQNECINETTVIITEPDDTQLSITVPSANLSSVVEYLEKGNLFTGNSETSVAGSVELYNTSDYLEERLLMGNISTNEAFDELQGLYIKGKVSYIRTENKKYEVLNGEHAGIYAKDLEEDSTEDGHLKLIQNRTALHLNKDKFIITIPSLHDELISVCDKAKARINKVYKIERKKENTHLISPPAYFYPTGAQRSPKKRLIQCFEHNKELMILNVLKTLNLGQSSTLHMHVNKINKFTKVSDNELKLTTQGVRCTFQTDPLSLLLKDAHITQRLNELINNNTLSIEEKNQKCLNILQLPVPKTTSFGLDV